MRVLFLAAEAAPFVKVGGLADVAGSLPGALRALGHDVRLAIPGYGALDWPGLEPKLAARFDLPHAGGSQTAEIYEMRPGTTPVILVTGPPIPKDRRIYGSGIAEDAPKFVFFSLAALFACEALGWKPDVVHANDWHTGTAVQWLAAHGRANDFFRPVASVFTIHNLLYRGEGAGRALAEYGVAITEIARALPDWLRDSPLGLALLAADMLSTVSPTYAREILTPAFGEGLDGVLRARQDRLAGNSERPRPTTSGTRRRTRPSPRASTPAHASAAGRTRRPSRPRPGSRRSRARRSSPSSRGWTRRRASTSRCRRCGAGSRPAASSFCSARARPPSSTTTP